MDSETDYTPLTTPEGFDEVKSLIKGKKDNVDVNELFGGKRRKSKRSSKKSSKKSRKSRKSRKSQDGGKRRRTRKSKKSQDGGKRRMTKKSKKSRKSRKSRRSQDGGKRRRTRKSKESQDGGKRRRTKKSKKSKKSRGGAKRELPPAVKHFSSFVKMIADDKDVEVKYNVAMVVAKLYKDEAMKKKPSMDTVEAVAEAKKAYKDDSVAEKKKVIEKAKKRIDDRKKAK